MRKGYTLMHRVSARELKKENKMQRTSRIERTTGETDIKLKLFIDSEGESRILSPVNFLNHMLELFAFHSGFQLDIEATGDTEVDDHHTVEDLAICLGQALREALGDKKGIARYGSFTIPMDEARATVVLDFSGRPLYKYEGPVLSGKTGTFDSELLHEFMRGLAQNAGLTLHITVESGENLHHILEAVFKATARACAAAVRITGDRIPSSKGKLE